MLSEAVARTAQFADRLTYIWQDARNLPFDDDTFDAVTCLEALEFTPAPREVLAELVRVLRPGGVLLTTNRIGRDAKFLPGRALSFQEFELALQALSLEKVKTQHWQMDYDLVWAVKTGTPKGGGVHPLPDIMRCPTCTGRIERAANGFHCLNCNRLYAIAKDGVIEMARAHSPT
jgi:SAM-dependent methyltransferase